MAGAHGAAATTSSYFPPAPPTPGKSLVLASSLPSPFPSRRRRTNHLRQKILKTLEITSYPDFSDPKFPRKTPTISIEETVQQQPAVGQQFSFSEATGFVDDIVGKFSTKSFAKIGLYLVGAFIFQTICAVLIFGSHDLQDEDGQLNSNDNKKVRVLDLGKSKSSSLFSGNQNLVETEEGGIVFVDESEMDYRIMEIQEMAREARQRGKLEAQKNSLVEEENDDVDYDLIEKTMKENEVDGRLMKLRNSLEGKKLPLKLPRNNGDVSNNVGKSISATEDAFGPLMFKKKYRYKSPSIDSGDKPRGFDDTNDGYISNGTLINGIIADDGSLQKDQTNDEGTSGNDISSDDEVDLLDNGVKINLSNDNKVQEPIDESMPVSEPTNKLVNRSEIEKPRVIKTESAAGTTKEPKYDKPVGRAAKSGKSGNLETRKPRGFGKENSDVTISTKHDDYNKNGGLKGRKGGNRKSGRNVGDMKSSTQTDYWWASLPYVLAVVMQRSGNGEESEGLFTIRSSSETKKGLSHTVAFEDRGDAQNFSYLLESFFENLDDFSTNIIPIPTNELEEALKSQIMKVVVVKKGQLQLYIGQPLSDVESVLRTLIKEET